MMIPNKRLLSIGIGLGVLILATQSQLSSTDTSNSAPIVSNGLGMNGEAVNQFSDSPANYINPSTTQTILDNQTVGTIASKKGQLVFRLSQ